MARKKLKKITDFEKEKVIKGQQIKSLEIKLRNQHSEEMNGGSLSSCLNCGEIYSENHLFSRNKVVKEIGEELYLRDSFYSGFSTARTSCTFDLYCGECDFQYNEIDNTSYRKTKNENDLILHRSLSYLLYSANLGLTTSSLFETDTQYLFAKSNLFEKMFLCEEKNCLNLNLRRRKKTLDLVTRKKLKVKHSVVEIDLKDENDKLFFLTSFSCADEEVIITSFPEGEKQYILFSQVRNDSKFKEIDFNEFRKKENFNLLYFLSCCSLSKRTTNSLQKENKPNPMSKYLYRLDILEPSSQEFINRLLSLNKSALTVYLSFYTFMENIEERFIARSKFILLRGEDDTISSFSFDLAYNEAALNLTSLNSEGNLETEIITDEEFIQEIIKESEEEYTELERMGLLYATTQPKSSNTKDD